MQLFYNPSLDANSSKLDFDREESKHISKVLRKNIGDKIMVTNGNGILFTGKIIAQSNVCTIQIVEKSEHKPLEYYLHMAVAPTKMNDRFEWFLEKATEIGVSEITPIFCRNSERRKINHERFEKIILSAMKQSNQYFLPKLNEAVEFSEFLKRKIEGEKFIAHCEEDQKSSLKGNISPNKRTTILIGPEGDFSKDEIEIATKNLYIPVSLGNTRLRTETAALVACHTVALANEKI